LFVCLFVTSGPRLLRKNYSSDFHKKSVGKWHVHELQKKPIDFGGNPDHATLGKD